MDHYDNKVRLLLVDGNEYLVPREDLQAISGSHATVSFDPKKGTPTVEQVNQFVSSTGAKRNTIGKTPYEYLPLDLLDGAAEVMGKGAVKYGENNYRKGFPPLMLLGSLIRHLTETQRAICEEDKDNSKGRLCDKETTLAHVHHILTSTLLLIDSMRKDGYKI